MAVPPSRRNAGGLAGFHIKHVKMLALVLQNSALVMFLCYSRTMPLVSGQRYFASTAIFLSELVKLAFFLSMAIFDVAMGPHSSDTSTVGGLFSTLTRAVFTGDSWKMVVPALFYAVQNTFQYIAASNLEPAVFATTYQLKIVFTAIFGVVLAGRSLNLRQCLALALLAFGIVVVQLSSIAGEGHELSIHDLKAGMSIHKPRSVANWIDDWYDPDAHTSSFRAKRSATYEGIETDFAAANPRVNVSIGLGAAVAACVLSGAAGMIFENMVKVKSEFGRSIWIRNAQLSFYSIWPTLFIGVVFLDGEYIGKTGFFTGYNSIVWIVISLQVLGGALVASILSEADTLTKALTASVSLPIVVVAGAVMFAQDWDIWILLGTITTFGASYLFYSASGLSAHSRAPPISVSQYDKGSRPDYFSLEPSSTIARSPLRDSSRDALSTSRPGTPVSGRRHLKTKVGDGQ